MWAGGWGENCRSLPRKPARRRPADICFWNAGLAAGASFIAYALQPGSIPVPGGEGGGGWAEIAGLRPVLILWILRDWGLIGSLTQNLDTAVDPCAFSPNRRKAPGMTRDLAVTLAHPGGEQPPVEEWSAIADTFGGRVHVEWGAAEPVTPLGQLAFFIEYLKQGGLFDGWVADCPLSFTSRMRHASAMFWARCCFGFLPVISAMRTVRRGAATR